MNTKTLLAIGLTVYCPTTTIVVVVFTSINTQAHKKTLIFGFFFTVYENSSQNKH